jgi:hypothetical protein
VTEAVKERARSWWPYAMVTVIALVAVLTVSNQVRINHTNRELARQAHAGQLGLNRTCALVPISKKIYADFLHRGVITRQDYLRVFGTAERACASATPSK